MKFSIRLAILGLAVLTTFASCVSNKKYNELLEEKEALAKSLAESQEAIKVLEEENAALEEAKNNLTNEVAAIKADLDAQKKEIAKVKQLVEQKEAELSQLKGEVDAAFAEYKKAGLTVTNDDHNLYISMPEKVLFRSGSASLDKSDKEIIKKLSEILVNNPDIAVFVEGHTDDQKLVEGARYADNWELSTARAVAVTRQMIKDGVKPTQVTAAGSGEYSPAVTENPKSSETRQANRRTEFILSPNVKKLYDLVK